MPWITICLAVTIGCVGLRLAVASDGVSSQQPSAQERLQQVLDAEGGATVYMDPVGNVHTTTDLPNGERIEIVQPPQSPAINLGPPLQLNNQTIQLPPPPAPPVQPLTPEFPQRAR